MIGEVFHDQALGINETYSAAISVELSPSANGQFIVVVTDDTQTSIPSLWDLFGGSQTSIPSPFTVVQEVFEDNNATAVAADVTPVLADLVVNLRQLLRGEAFDGRPTLDRADRDEHSCGQEHRRHEQHWRTHANREP